NSLSMITPFLLQGGFCFTALTEFISTVDDIFPGNVGQEFIPKSLPRERDNRLMRKLRLRGLSRHNIPFILVQQFIERVLGLLLGKVLPSNRLSLFHRRPFPSISHVSERSCLYGLTFHSDSDTIGLNAVFGCVDIDTRHCTCSLRLSWNSRRS